MSDKLTKYVFFKDAGRYIKYLEQLISEEHSLLFNFVFGEKNGDNIESVVRALLLLEKARYLDNAESYNFLQAEKKLKLELVGYLVANFLKNAF